MAKYRGDYYTITLDERELGGDMTTLAAFDDWREAQAAWEAMPEPEQGCIWFGKCNHIDKSYSEAISCKGPDKDPLFEQWVQAIDELIEEGSIKVRGKKATRH